MTGTNPLDGEAQGFLPLRPPVLEILLTLAEGPLHGYAIIQALKDPEGANLRVETGPLYRHLRRLLEHGLVSQSEEPPAGTKDDERRKAYYALTPLGEAVVRLEGLRLAGLVRQTRRVGLLPEGGAP
ncbi:MAG: PadR family transcriptional regulator [Gemmatimonadetes bacterium]|nr:PadR family transcriptional regulator [Gemmatimonadota bacterium]